MKMRRVTLVILFVLLFIFAMSNCVYANPISYSSEHYTASYYFAIIFGVAAVIIVSVIFLYAIYKMNSEDTKEDDK